MTHTAHRPVSSSSATDGPFDGDPAWRVTRFLRDGTPVALRPVVPEDREGLRRAFLELSPESRYFRFLQLSTTPSEELLTYLTVVDQTDHVAMAMVLESPDLKTERGIGIARFVRLKDIPNTAEAAITVVDDMHRRGVGTILLRELLRAAMIRDIKTVRAEVLADNETMRAILERAGSHAALEDADAGTIAYDLALGEDEPTEALSLFEVLRGAAETMALRFRFRLGV